MENVLSLYPGQSWDTSILPVLSSYGEPFMDAVCRDSCDGHDVGRVRQEKPCYMGLACDPGLPADCSHSSCLLQTVPFAQVRDLALLFQNLFKNVQRKIGQKNVRLPMLHGVNVERNIVAQKIIVTNRPMKQNRKLYLQ